MSRLVDFGVFAWGGWPQKLKHCRPSTHVRRRATGKLRWRFSWRHPMGCQMRSLTTPPSVPATKALTGNFASRGTVLCSRKQVGAAQARCSGPVLLHGVASLGGCLRTLMPSLIRPIALCFAADEIVTVPSKSINGQCRFSRVRFAAA